MTPEQIAAALTSGLAGPIVGACLVLAAWLLGKLKSGMPMIEQLKHAATVARPLLVPVLVVAGAALMAGVGVVPTVTLAVTALLTAGGWAAPKPKQRRSLRYVVDIDTSKAEAAFKSLADAADAAADKVEAVDTPKDPSK